MRPSPLPNGMVVQCYNLNGEDLSNAAGDKVSCLLDVLDGARIGTRCEIICIMSLLRLRRYCCREGIWHSPAPGYWDDVKIRMWYCSVGGIALRLGLNQRHRYWDIVEVLGKINEVTQNPLSSCWQLLYYIIFLQQA